MSFRDALFHLAELQNISTGYRGSDGNWHEASEDTLIKILAALGVRLGTPSSPPDEEDVERAIQRHFDDVCSRPLPPCVVTIAGEPCVFPVHVHEGEQATVTLVLEDGSQAQATQVENHNAPRQVGDVLWGEASFALPEDLPLGWHSIRLESTNVSDSCTLVVTPRRLTTMDPYLDKPASGVMAQLYSVRSAGSWGIGDFQDLADLSALTAQQAHADFVLINPLHAAEAFPPVEDSPYLPTSRRFINPIYIRPENTAEYAAAPQPLRDEVDALQASCGDPRDPAALLQRDQAYAAKLQALRLLFAAGLSDERQEAFSAYCDMEGAELDGFAHFCANAEFTARAAGQPVAGIDTHAPVPAEIDDSAENIQRSQTFYKWLQFLCDEQLGAAQHCATEAGMRIGLMADLAVGVHPAGASAHTLNHVLVADASVGAPPDGYNQQGQDWSQPPWHPVKLAEAGYGPWRDMLRTVLRHAGGIRIDHVLGLFRLFWIPRMQSPLTGAYVNYDHAAMIGIVALEAERAGAVVIGEDLGTFEPWVQEYLNDRGIGGTSVLWFEGDPDGSGARRQHNYRRQALTSVTTHDLPPTAGYLAGEHIRLRHELGILTSDLETEYATDFHWQNTVLQRVQETGCFADTSCADTDFQHRARPSDGDAPNSAMVQDLLVGVHRFINGTPSALACTALVDMVGDRRTQNQPGTTKDLYPNWCIPLCDGSGNPVLVEDLASHPMFQAIAATHRQ
ncbi:4-alpha-glucanotransferase [Corynebacterium choanae]|uniref:4-alpha-glucanotransferase n=1 Tax=Corynebacterium choanae TaxID=1862358 RepID=A0A3G6J7H7_9CORY|nr:4-alpha-glucanotransferase [Corynebacterium choanae]AZA14071.1 4-alpha-glucanotransferase [Corynebacterium choanae]